MHYYHNYSTSVGESAAGNRFVEGNLIQIPSPDPSQSMRYGTIKWIGLLPGVVEEVAGIELV